MTNGLAGCSNTSTGLASCSTLPLVHDDDAVGELERLFLIVGDEHARQMNLLVKAPQPAAQLLPDLRVERAERLVEQQHLRLDRERASERDALPLSSRQLRRIAIAEVIELHELQQVGDFVGDLLGRRTMRARPHAKTERDVLEHRHVTEERVMLKHEPDAALAGLPLGGVLAVEQHAPLHPATRGRRRCAATSSCRSPTDQAAQRARPARTSKLTSRSAAKLPNCLLTFRMSMPIYRGLLMSASTC